MRKLVGVFVYPVRLSQAVGFLCITAIIMAASGCTTEQVARFESKAAGKYCRSQGIADADIEHVGCVENTMAQWRANDRLGLPPAQTGTAQNEAEHMQAASACNAAGYSPESGRHDECVTNTLVAHRQQLAQAQQQQALQALAIGAQLWGQSRAGAAAGSRSTYDQGNASLSGQRRSGYQNHCDYRTPTQMVTVIVNGSCPATYRY